MAEALVQRLGFEDDLQRCARCCSSRSVLESAFSGSAGDPNNPSAASAVVTARTITARVEWGAQCGPGATPRAGSMAVALLARRGNVFGFEIGAEGWTGTVAGTIGSSITLDVSASGTFDGSSCDTGPVRITLART